MLVGGDAKHLSKRPRTYLQNHYDVYQIRSTLLFEPTINGKLISYCGNDGECVGTKCDFNRKITI